MADTIESDETLTNTNKEPVKNEESATSTSNNDERNEDANSPPPNCSICLGKLINTSFTDSCLHQFCFTCLLQWSRIKTECPLCKQTFKSIIHNVRSEEDYDQYHVPRELVQPLPLTTSQLNTAIEINFAVARNPREREMRRFAYRTTMFQRGNYEIHLNTNQLPRQQPQPTVAPSLSREERRYLRVSPVSYRRNIYHTGEWSNIIPDVYGRFRESSANYYRRHPEELDRLIPWINRDLLILSNANRAHTLAMHIAYVIRIIMDALTRYDMRSPEFHDLLRPHFNVHTHHFIHELMNFCRSGLNVADYDAFITYSPCNSNQGLSGGYWNIVQSPVSSTSSNSSSSDDSDVRVVERVDNNTNNDPPRPNIEIPGLSSTFSELNMPGPSTINETFNIDSSINSNNDTTIIDSTPAVPCVLTISSSASSDSDECEVVGYVKPRHERTPEIIELVSSDDEGIIANVDDDHLLSPPKTPTILCNDEMPSTSNENNDKTNARSNQRPKTNNLSLQDLTKESSSEVLFDSDSDSDSDFVICQSQKRKSRRNTRRDVKKIDRKTTKRLTRKRNKTSTSDSVDSKKGNKRRRNSNGMNNYYSKTGRNVAKIISSSSDDDNNDGAGWKRLKVRKDLMISEWRRKSRSRLSDSDESSRSRSRSSSSNSKSISSVSTSSSTSSSTTSTSSSIFGSATSLNSNNNSDNQSKNKTHKRNKIVRDNGKNKSKSNANQIDNSKSKNKKLQKPKLKSTVVKCQRPVNSTLLRKDTDKKEWYVDNDRKSRSRSRSRSYDLQHDNNSRSYPLRVHRRHRSNSNSSIDNHRERRLALRIASERLKNQNLYSTADSQNEDGDDNDYNDKYNYERSTSKGSLSDKYSNSTKYDKHNSKHNNKKKYNKDSKDENDEELTNTPSTSTSPPKYSENKNNSNEKKNNSSNTKSKTHKKNKDLKQSRTSSSSKPKSKRSKRYRAHSFLSSSSSSSSSLSSTSSSSD